jgi:hypothetical protein
MKHFKWPVSLDQLKRIVQQKTAELIAPLFFFPAIHPACQRFRAFIEDSLQSTFGGRECVSPVEFSNGNPVQQGELEHFQAIWHTSCISLPRREPHLF